MPQISRIWALKAALVQHMDTYKSSSGYFEDYENYEYNEDEHGPSSPKQAKFDASSESQSANLTDKSYQSSSSRLSDLSKKFKVMEVTDKRVDEVFAGTVNDLFQKEMDSEMYDNLVKGDSFARPENCEGLVSAKMNKLFWDVMSTQSRTTDKKKHIISTSTVKAGICLTLSKMTNFRLFKTERVCRRQFQI